MSVRNRKLGSRKLGSRKLRGGNLGGGKLRGGGRRLAVVRAVAACSVGALATLGATGAVATASGATTTRHGATRLSRLHGLPSLHRATGKPLVVGYVNDDTGAIGAFPETTAGTKATVAYVNNYLDGINNRPIQLVACSDDATPAQASSCAIRVLQHNPVAILGGVDFATAASIPLFHKAGVPYIGGLAFTGPENTDPLSFQWNSITSNFAVMPFYGVRNLHAKRISILYPAGIGTDLSLAQLMQQVAVNLGLAKSDVTLVSYDATSPDMTAPIEAANKSKPSMIIGITSGPQCVTLAQARQELGVKATLFLPGGCFGPQLNKQAGSAYDGVYGGQATPVPGSPQFASKAAMKLFYKILGLYSPATVSSPLISFAFFGYGDVLNFRQVLLRLNPKAITSKSIVAAFRKTVNASNVLGPSFSCAKPPIKQVSALCTVASGIYKIRNGQSIYLGAYNPGPYVKSVPGIS